MIGDFNSSDSASIEKMANNAFSAQTFSLKAGVFKYVKPDVNEANQAYEAYVANKTHDTLVQFQNAVDVCVKNSRTGFKKLNQALLEALSGEQHLRTDSVKKISPR